MYSVNNPFDEVWVIATDTCVQQMYNATQVPHEAARDASGEDIGDADCHCIMAHSRGPTQAFRQGPRRKLCTCSENDCTTSSF